MNNAELATYIRNLIQEDKLYRFYKSKDWITLRGEVLKENHNECAHCSAHGIYRRATIVHHINEVRKRPDLALSKEYADPITGEKKKNLIALCFACHEQEHDRLANYKTDYGLNRFVNEERW